MAKTYTRDELIEKVGGQFKLCALINKRKKELALGLPPLLDIDSADVDVIIGEEIMQDKIKLNLAEVPRDEFLKSSKLDLIR